MTGILQNYARKYKIPIDTVSFQYQTMPKAGDYSCKPEDGCYSFGMFVEGARWSDEKMMLVESRPKQLFTAAPLLWMQPTEVSQKRHFPNYLCPVYRTTERRGVLATTGHSSNFVTNVELPSDQPNDHWTRRGVAMLLSLSD